MAGCVEASRLLGAVLWVSESRRAALNGKCDVRSDRDRMFNVPVVACVLNEIKSNRTSETGAKSLHLQC